MADTLLDPAPPATAPRYRTAPSQTETGMPPGVPYIIGNEASERFSYYGMKSILTIFMTTYLLDRSGQKALMDETTASAWSHLFVFAVYFTPVLGAFLADAVWGKFRTIFTLSIVYCLGHLALALDDTRVGLGVGLGLIALGAGGIKPCVSANVGDQFGESNKQLLSKVFSWFYFSINAGSFISIYTIPLLLKHYGPHLAFGLPGVLMVIATIIFWMGRHRFVHIPPAGLSSVRQLFDAEGRGVLKRLAVVYVFVTVFWALWDQSNGVEWTLQAAKMDLHFLGLDWLPAQVQVVNGLFVLLFIPLFNYVIYPALDRVFPLTPLRKIGLGFFVTGVSFLVIAWIQRQIEAGGHPNIIWQILAYAILTAGEVMVSITGLEFSYTQAPNRLKSAVMALWLLTVAFGNLGTSGLNFIIPWLGRQGVHLEGTSYFMFFVVLMFLTTAAFAVVVRRYQYRTYIQHSEEGAPINAPVATINSAVGEV